MNINIEGYDCLVLTLNVEPTKMKNTILSPNHQIPKKINISHDKNSYYN